MQGDYANDARWYFLMKVEETSNIIQKLINEIQSFATDWNRLAGLDLIGNINRRVVMTGIDSAGNAMTNRRGQTYGSSYAAYRRGQGATISKRVYNLTGDLWSGIKVSAANEKEFTIGGVTPYSKYVLNDIQKRDGYNLVMPNEKEIELTKEFLRKKLLQTLNKYL